MQTAKASRKQSSLSGKESAQGCFGHLMQRADSLEKTLMLGGIGGRRHMSKARDTKTHGDRSYGALAAKSGNLDFVF